MSTEQMAILCNNLMSIRLMHDKSFNEEEWLYYNNMLRLTSKLLSLTFEDLNGKEEESPP